ncbi:hypothetical protein LSPCS325_51750 [Lysinibacillus sp. CTST325]
MNKSFNHDGHSSFKKELAKLEKKHPEQYNKIYIELRKLEKRTAFIQKGKQYPGLKKVNNLYQFTIDDHRILFDIKNNAIIFYLLLFEKKSKSTPQRYYKIAKKRRV